MPKISSLIEEFEKTVEGKIFSDKKINKSTIFTENSKMTLD